MTGRPPGEPEPDVELYRIAHRAMEREAAETAALAERLVGGAPYSKRQARGLRRAVRILLDDLDRHHRAEDDVGWPILRAANPDPEVRTGTAPLLAALGHDHERLHRTMTAMRTATEQLAGQPEHPAVRRALAGAAAQLADQLGRHIADEEAVIFPLISASVSVADFTRWEKAADHGIPLRDLPILLPSTLRVVDPADRARITAQAPFAFRLALRLGTGYFHRRHQLVFGGPEPPARGSH